MKKLKFIASNIPEIISGIGFCVMLLVVFFNVVLRYFFNYSLIWCEEVAALGFTYAIFVGAAACFKRKALIGIDVFVASLPAATKKTAQTAVNLLMIVANVLFCYLSLLFSLGAWTKMSLSLVIPFTFVDMSVTIGFLFMTYYSVKHFIWDIQGKKFVNPDEIIQL